MKDQKHQVLKENSGAGFPKQKRVQKRLSKINRAKHQTFIYDNKETIKSEIINSERVYIETDVRFYESLTQIFKTRKNVLKQFLSLKQKNLTEQQCDQIDYQAKFHSAANIFNKNSDKKKSDMELIPILKANYCDCGCDAFKGGFYSVLQDIQSKQVLGSGVILLFFWLKIFGIALFSFTIIFGIFALTTNLIGGNNQLPNKECTDFYCSFRDLSSSYNKASQNFNQIESWLGLAASCVWLIIMILVSEYGQRLNKQIDKKLTSSSDCAIKIDDLPFGDYNEEQLLIFLQGLWQKSAAPLSDYNEKESNLQLHTWSDAVLNNFYIKSIQIIYNMQFSRKLVQKLSTHIDKAFGLLQQTKQGLYIKDVDAYRSCKKQLITTYESCIDLRKKFLTDGNFRQTISTSCAIMQFKDEKAKNLFLLNFKKKSGTFFGNLVNRMRRKCCPDPNQIIFKGSRISIQRAPQPSDVLWQNCQKKFSYCRIFCIFLGTLVIILLSFGITTGLNYLQQILLKSPTANQSTILLVLNTVISLVFLIFNVIIWQIILWLLKIEYNHTCSQTIVSQMNKSVALICVNVIVLPIITNVVLQDTFYGVNGLSGFVFDYHMTAMTINLILKLIDPPHLILAILLNIKCIRNFILKVYYRAVDDKKMSQRAIFKLYEGSYFDIAQIYVYIIVNAYMAFFFCHLQPSVLVLLTLECFFFFWICKIQLFKFCKVPEMTQITIFQVAISMSMLIPVFYGGGTIFLRYIQKQKNSPSALTVNLYIPEILCMCLGFAVFTDFFQIFSNFAKFLINNISCLSAERVFSQKNQEQIGEIRNRTKRLENYYKSSNTLKLLGFEKMLVEENDEQVVEELQNYCCSHVKIRDKEVPFANETSIGSLHMRSK